MDTEKNIKFLNVMVSLLFLLLIVFMIITTVILEKVSEKVNFHDAYIKINHIIVEEVVITLNETVHGIADLHNINITEEI